jgi:hypothetical protein
LYIKFQQYLDAAEQDRERYLKELEAYKQTDAYKVYTKKQREHKHSKASQGSKTQIEALPLPKTPREPKVIIFFSSRHFELINSCFKTIERSLG